jgi:WD40 repeat protein
MNVQSKRFYLLITIYFLLMHFASAQDAEYLIRVFNEHSEAVNTVAFSKSGKYMASGAEDKALIIREINGEVIIKHKENYFAIKDIEFFGDKQLFVTAGKDVKLIDLENSTLALYKGSSTHVWSFDFAPERNKLVAGSYDSKIKTWDVRTEEIELVLDGHNKSALSAAYSYDEKYIVSGSRDERIMIWNAKSGELMHSLERHSGNIYDIQFHPNTKYFASASGDKTIRLWDIESAKVVKTYVGHESAVLDIEFSPDGYFMYSAGLDGVVFIWEVASGKKLYSYILHTGSVNSVAISNDGHYAATCGNDKKVMLWKSAKHIAVDLYFKDLLNAKKEMNNIFDDRRKGESRSDFNTRLNEAHLEELKLIDELFNKYIEKVNYKNIP